MKNHRFSVFASLVCLIMLSFGCSTRGPRVGTLREVPRRYGDVHTVSPPPQVVVQPAQQPTIPSPDPNMAIPAAQTATTKAPPTESAPTTSGQKPIVVVAQPPLVLGTSAGIPPAAQASGTPRVGWIMNTMVASGCHASVQFEDSKGRGFPVEYLYGTIMGPCPTIIPTGNSYSAATEWSTGRQVCEIWMPTSELDLPAGSVSPKLRLAGGQRYVFHLTYTSRNGRWAAREHTIVVPHSQWGFSRPGFIGDWGVDINTCQAP